MKSFEKDKGFTLLEVMISLAIAGGLLMTLLYTLNHHLEIAQRQFVLTRMTSLAKAELRKMEKTPRAGEGRFPEPDADLSYKTGIQGSRFPEMSEIFVAVENGRERIVLNELMHKTK